MTCTPKHPDECAGGWIFVGSGVRPCERCWPGKAAVWRAGRLRGGWTNDPEARALFPAAEGRDPQAAPSGKTDRRREQLVR